LNPLRSLRARISLRSLSAGRPLRSLDPLRSLWTRVTLRTLLSCRSLKSRAIVNIHDQVAVDVLGGDVSRSISVEIPAGDTISPVRTTGSLWSGWSLCTIASIVSVISSRPLRSCFALWPLFTCRSRERDHPDQGQSQGDDRDDQARFGDIRPRGRSGHRCHLSGHRDRLRWLTDRLTTISLRFTHVQHPPDSSITLTDKRIALVMNDVSSAPLRWWRDGS
jgi:hypothetical protein